MKVIFFVLNILISVDLMAADTSELCRNTKQNTLQYENKIISRPENGGQFKVLSWNGHKYADKNYFKDLKKLSESADIIMLQEVIHSTDWQALFLNHLPFSFSFFKSFCTNHNQATGVQNGARFPLFGNLNLVSPDQEPITNTPKVSGISRIEIPGYGTVLIVNTHALNFNPGNSFERHINQIANYIATQTGPVIWAGDFNTWNPKRQKYLNYKVKELALKNVNPANDNRTQKLDHIFVRGFTVISAEVLNQTSSDHRPLSAVLKFEN